MRNKLNKNFIICGPIAAGKDTVGGYIQGIRLAFADNLRLVVKLLRANQIWQAHDLMVKFFGNNPPGDLAYKLNEFSKIPRTDEKDRLLLQELGTYARKHKDDVWISAVRQQIKPENNYVICDCRRLSELKAFPDFISIYVDAPLEIRKERLIVRDGTYDTKWETHEAEVAIPQLKPLCDFVITNNGTLSELYDEIYGLMCYLGRDVNA